MILIFLFQVIRSSSDMPAEYVATMNCIFAAQKNVSMYVVCTCSVTLFTVVFVCRIFQLIPVSYGKIPDFYNRFVVCSKYSV